MIHTIRNIHDLAVAPNNTRFSVYHLEENLSDGHCKILYNRDDVIDYLSQIESKVKIIFYED